MLIWCLGFSEREDLASSAGQEAEFFCPGVDIQELALQKLSELSGFSGREDLAHTSLCSVSSVARLLAALAPPIRIAHGCAGAAKHRDVPVRRTGQRPPGELVNLWGASISRPISTKKFGLERRQEAEFFVEIGRGERI